MRLKNITAKPHPYGNRIDLNWENPEPDNYPGVKVVRREGTFPTSPEDGFPVVERNAFLFSTDLGPLTDLDNRSISSELRQQFFDSQVLLSSNAFVTIESHGSRWVINDKEQKFVLSRTNGEIHVYRKGIDTITDQNLKSETVYYYSLFPFKGSPPEYVFDRYNRSAAMATGQYNTAGQMYNLLPGIYHRYDTVLSDQVADQDREKGELRRFLDIPGSLFDQFHSFAKAVLDMHNLDKVDGRLLPLLAQWIAWKTDFSLEIECQRNEIRNSPDLYKRIGLIPTVEATVKRMSGWESRTKEFVHNVFLSNRPERLNIWAKQRSSTGEWSDPKYPTSLDFAYEGRPAAVQDTNNEIWLFYHTNKKRQWRENKTYREVCNIWYKKQSVFSIESEFMDVLNNLDLSPALQQAFKEAGHSISRNTTIALVEQDSMWVIEDANAHRTYTAMSEGNGLKVYTWTPSEPLTNRLSIDKYPTTAMQGDTLWVFWSVYNEQDKKWHIEYRTRTGEEWLPIQSDSQAFADTEAERKRPLSVVDDSGGLWLFWLEKVNTRWQMKYNRHDGSSWGTEVSFPLDGGQDPRVEGDPFVLFHPAEGPARRFWVFWSRQELMGEPGQTRWTIVCRVKENTSLDATGWSNVQPLFTLPPQYNDREPSAFVNKEENIELFWSSDRNGSWSIWQRTLDVSADTWGAEDQVTTTAYSQRDPLPLAINDSSLLIYHSNKNITYCSDVYGATDTTDLRYSGSTTVDTRNTEKIVLQKKFEDFQTYTYDTGKEQDDWYARDTIGLYLENNTMDKEKIKEGVDRIDMVLDEFLPITDRAVFITQQDVHTEHVYTYGSPFSEESRFINESYNDNLTSISEETVPGAGEVIS